MRERVRESAQEKSESESLCAISKRPPLSLLQHLPFCVCRVDTEGSTLLICVSSALCHIESEYRVRMAWLARPKHLSCQHWIMSQLFQCSIRPFAWIGGMRQDWTQSGIAFQIYCSEAVDQEPTRTRGSMYRCDSSLARRLTAHRFEFISELGLLNVVILCVFCCFSM